MKYLIAVVSLTLLAACQSAPNLENDTRYVKMAKVVDVHEFTDAERKEATKALGHGNSGMGVGVGIGVGSGGGFGGLMFGVGTSLDGRDVRHEPPQIAGGANRYTVQPLNSGERIEVMSYKHYKVGDCVKVLSGHPTEYARLFDPKAGEHCDREAAP